MSIRETDGLAVGLVAVCSAMTGKRWAVSIENMATMVHHLLRIGNTAPAEPLEQLQFRELFEEQATRSPEAIAVIAEHRQFTYSGLNASANQLARFLKRFGVGPDSVVGLCVERSPETILGILGILKAGAGYLSLDPTFPPDRLSRLIQDANIFVVLTQAHLLDSLPKHNGPRLCLDSDWEIIAKERPDDCNAFRARAAGTPHWKRSALRGRRTSGLGLERTTK